MLGRLREKFLNFIFSMAIHQGLTNQYNLVKEKRTFKFLKILNTSLLPFNLKFLITWFLSYKLINTIETIYLCFFYSKKYIYTSLISSNKLYRMNQTKPKIKSFQMIDQLIKWPKIYKIRRRHIKEEETFYTYVWAPTVSPDWLATLTSAFLQLSKYSEWLGLLACSFNAFQKLLSSCFFTSDEITFLTWDGLTW